MTAQISDVYKVGFSKYRIVALSDEISFDPEEYGLHPTAPHTACWRGYWCEYTITGEELILDKLHVYCSDDVYPAINGKKATRESGDDMYVYHSLKLKIDYDGSIVLGNGFIDRYYIHMGYQPAWAFLEVIELVFEHGKVIKKIDHSDVVAQIRRQIDTDPTFMNDYRSNILNFINRSFSLDAKEKAWWI